ncbi:MAG: HAD family hydrolase [Prochlorococcaceae cyanobacterium]
MVHLQLRGQPLCTRGGHPAAIEAVLFDKDGTLSISEPMLKTLAEARVLQCLALVAKRHPELRPQAPGAELEALLRRAYGLHNTGVHPAGTTAVGSRAHNLISTATVLAQVGLGWPEALELAELVFAITDGLHGHGSPQRPQTTDGLHDLVSQLVAAGVRCAVISNDEIPGIEAFLKAHALEQHFSALWSAEHTPRKPDPAAVHGLCAELGVPAERCALIGDANSDLRMARAAGVPVVLGYTAAWSTAPPLDASFEQLQHWSELSVVAKPSARPASVGE